MKKKVIKIFGIGAAALLLVPIMTIITSSEELTVTPITVKVKPSIVTGYGEGLDVMITMLEVAEIAGEFAEHTPIWIEWMQRNHRLRNLDPDPQKALED